MEQSVIILNGPSSSGKSTLARALRNLIRKKSGYLYEIVSIDDFLKMSVDEAIYEDDVFEISPALIEAALGALRTGSGVIIDHVITSKRIFDGLAESLGDCNMKFIHVTCPREILQAREAERRDRCLGSAEASDEYLFPKDGYDLTVDTHAMSTEECAEQIFTSFFNKLEKNCDPDKTEVVLKTERLFLRKMNTDDFDALYRVLADTNIMQHYPYVFDERRVREWIERNVERYRKDGFGLWAVCLKDTGEMIGDCGLTLQNIKGEMLPEIGYHIHRDFQRKGYAKEASKAVMDWTFRNTDYSTLYSYCKYTNIPSIRTAESIGMRFSCEYPDKANGITHVSVISKEDWLNELTEHMILWAKDKLGNIDYAGWCLSFIEDALEKSNGIEIFGGDSAKESCELYKDALMGGAPERGAFVFYDCLCQSENGPVNWGHCGISLGDGHMIHAWDKVRIDDYLEIEKLTALTGDHPNYLGWVPLERIVNSDCQADAIVN